MAVLRILALFLLLGLGTIPTAWAEETDQFTLPPGELTNLGPVTSLQMFEVLEQVVAQTNAEIQMLRSKAQHSRLAAWKLATRRSDVYLADLFYSKTGPGYPRWLHWSRLLNPSKPMEYKEKKPWKTIYWKVFSQSPLFVIGLTPTINMYDYYFGTDKLGHFFMQGHTYFKMYSYLIHHGKTPEQAHDMMVLYGQIIEQTYLGTLINGVYSNADLSANYSGWKFYTNLTHEIRIGNRTLPPILVLNGDRWEFNKNINKAERLKLYLSDNLNEALNPSRYAFMRGQIRKHVKARCNEWIEREGITKPIVEEKLAQGRLWHGENYGYWLPVSDAVTLETCFDKTNNHSLSVATRSPYAKKIA